MDQSINILYYFEPWIELSRPHLRYHNLRYQMGPQIRDVKNNCPGATVKIALGEGTFHKCQVDKYDFEGCDYVVLKRNELLQFGHNYLSSSISLFNNDRELGNSYASYLRDKLNGWQPDVVISFLAPLPDLSQVWPGVTAIYAEFGMFSRAPYPRTFYFDPEGMFRDSIPRKYAKDLLKDSIDLDSTRHLNNFRENYLFPFYKQRPILDEELTRSARQFECKLLLPLQFSGYFGFDCCSSYADQFELLIDVLDSIPHEIGLFVTEHAGWQEVITEHNIGFLRDRYPNLLWSPCLSRIRAASQYLMTEVDGVITVSSSVGMQCLAWDKPIFSPWDSHLKGFSQVENLSEITVEKIRSYRSGTYDNAVVQLLTRYYLTEDIAYDGKKFLQFIVGVTQRNGAKCFADRLPALGTPAEVFKSLRQAYREDEGHKVYVQDLGDEIEKIVRPISGQIPVEFSRSVENADVVSFDLFDTLIDRPFSAPHELFLYMQDQVRVLVGERSLEYHKLRRYAEHRARQVSECNEVSIGEIYDMFFAISGVSRSHKQALIDLEFATEMRFCRRRELGAKLYEYAMESGKQIIVISDFYYGEEYLRKLTDSLGYSGISRMYVSADNLESKKEGSLFKIVARLSPCDPSKILHIGDNRQSDIINAEKYGYRTFFTPRAIDRLKDHPVAASAWKHLLERSVFPSERAQLGQGVFFGLLSRKYFDSKTSCNSSFSDGDPSRLGYVVLGPLLFAFTQWMIDHIKRNKHRQIFFLSRDGRLFNRAYDLFTEVDKSLPPSTYLLSSRRAYGLASVYEVADAQDLISIPFEPTTIQDIFESRFSLRLDDEICGERVLEAAGLATLTAKVHPVHDLMRLKRLVALTWPSILEQAQNEREALLTYLAGAGVPSADNAALVDIGYAGTIQSYLTKLASSSSFSGYYFMTHAKAEEFKDKGLKINAFYRELVEHHLKKDFLSTHVSLFELLFSSAEGSLIRFESDCDGVSPVKKEGRDDPYRSRLVQMIQRGALDFIQDVLEYFRTEYSCLYYSRDFAVHHLEQLITSPDREDALLFNKVSAEDSFSALGTRFIISDVAGMLKKFNSRLTRDQARSLVHLSEWKAGARAILPQPVNARAKPQAPSKPSLKRVTEGKNTAISISRPIRLYRKFKNNPYLYFADSKIPPFRYLKRFFA